MAPSWGLPKRPADSMGLRATWHNPLGDEPESSAAARRRDSRRREEIPSPSPPPRRRNRDRSPEMSRPYNDRSDRSRDREHERERDSHRTRESRDGQYERSRENERHWDRSRSRSRVRDRSRSRSRSRDRRRGRDYDDDSRGLDRRRDRSWSRSRSRSRSWSHPRSRSRSRDRDRDYRRKRNDKSPQKSKRYSRNRSATDSSYSRSISRSLSPVKRSSPIKPPPPDIVSPPDIVPPSKPASTKSIPVPPAPPSPEALPVDRQPIKISFKLNGTGSAPPTGPRQTAPVVKLAPPTQPQSIHGAFKPISLAARARQPSPPRGPRSSLSSTRAPPPPSQSPSPPPPPPRQLPLDSKPVVPPAFHFRDLPKRVSDGEESSPPPPTVKAPSPPPEDYSWPALGPPACVLPDSTRGNFRCLYDPAIEGAKASGNRGKDRILRMDGIVRGVGPVTAEDPRLAVADAVKRKGTGGRKNRTGVYPMEFEWDEYSVGKKPQPPPTAVLLYGLNALTSTDQITKHIRPFGRFTDIDVKLDPKSGMQLGICRVKFELPEVAQTVAAQCDGQRIGTGAELAKAVLDGTGEKLEKAVKAEMARRYPPKVEAAAPPPPPKPATPLAVQASASPLPPPPRPFIPPPRRFQPALPPRALALPLRSQLPQPYRQYPNLPAHANLPPRPAQTQNLSQSFTSAPFDRRRRASSSVYTSDSESDDDRFYRDRYRRPVAKPKVEAIVTTEDIRPALLKNGYPHIVIDVKSLPLREATTDNVQVHFKAFKPLDVLSHTSGWFVLFGDGATAARAQRVLDKTMILRHRIGVSVGNPPTGLQANAALAPAPAPALAVVETQEDDGKGWKYLTFTKKNAPPKSVPVSVPAPSPSRKKAAPAIAESVKSDSSSDDGLQAVLDMVKQRKGRKKVPVVVESESEGSEIEVASAPAPELENGKPEDVEMDGIAVEPTIELEVVKEPVKKAKGKAVKKAPVKKLSKKAAAAAAAAAEAADDEIVAIEGDPVVAVEQVETPSIPPPKPKALKKPKVVKPPKAPKVVKAKAQAKAVPDILASEIFEDEEDLYLLRSAIEASRGSGLPPLRPPSPERQTLVHKTGCARTEGYYKVPEINKSAYLPQRNRAAADVEAFGGQATSRSARVNTRRLVQGMEHHKKAVATDTDIFQFNQLRTRKKQLKFSKSPIHDWGLYAMEFIPPGEMVIEYVGELVRAQVAETREKLYEKVGIGSSYLFRVDDDAVVDATKKGNLGRLINHCCTPNCTAKIITINGEKKIVIYAKTSIEPGAEITYDYHFPIENEKIVCLCGSVKCRGFLN